LNISVTIKGTNQILLHKYTVATVSEPKSRLTRGKDSSNFSDEWKKGTYIGAKGIVVMPAANILACLYDGAKGMKKGKTALTRLVYTSLVVSPFEAEILHEGKTLTLADIEENDLRHYSGAVVTGRRIDRIRTCLPIGWEIVFGITTKNEDLSFEDIKAIVDNAGKSAGLGDWRPSSPKKPGSNGTFEIVGFEKTG